MNPLRLKRAYFYPVTAVLMLFTAIVANGCVLIPVPTPPRGVRVITEDTVESLKPGQSTRADVLHLLGDPLHRREKDRFFVYAWDRTWGYVGWLSALASPDGGVSPIVVHRSLIIEFTPENRVRSLQLSNTTPHSNDGPKKRIDR
jgi:outer membrane protein assembly factor BamE (lipoprotein component of BamABCDE complex)